MEMVNDFSRKKLNYFLPILWSHDTQLQRLSVTYCTDIGSNGPASPELHHTSPASHS